MASPSVGGRPTCVSLLVLFSYAVLLFIGLLGLWLWGTNFGYQEASPPTPPPENITATTTTPSPSENSYYYRERHDMKVPQAYKDYVEQTTIFAQLTNDARFYLAPLCLVSLVVAGFTLLVGPCSRRLFGSTFSLYSSLCLWILTLVMTIVYQNNMAWRPFPSFMDTAAWVLGYHILLLVFLPLQMLLCVWELRRQQAKDWPTLNFRSVFTMEAVLLSARLALTVFTFADLLDSLVLRGFRGESDPRYDRYYGNPRVRYPIHLALVCFSAACFNAAATLETALSMVVGKLHRFMTTLTCLLSGLCCITIAILCSPVFVRLTIGPYDMYPKTMNWAIGLSVVTLLHWLARLIFPSALSTPPRILTLTMDRLVEVTSLSDIVAMIQTQGKKGSELLPKSMKYCKHIKVASVIFSIISLAVIGVSAGDTPSYRMWGHVMVLCANTVTILRTLPPLMTEYFFKETEIIPVKQKLFSLAIETVLLFVGGIVVCDASYYGIGVFGGVMNILFAVFQMLVMWSLYKDISQSQPCEDMERLTEGEEATSQEGDQTTLPDAMA